jgi:hypothetical protein
LDLDDDYTASRRGARSFATDRTARGQAPRRTKVAAVLVQMHEDVQRIHRVAGASGLSTNPNEFETDAADQVDRVAQRC